MIATPSLVPALSIKEGDQIKVLGLSIGPHKNVERKQFISRADAQQAPTLSLTGTTQSTPDAKYIVVGLDADAPFPSFSILGPILHWLQSGLQVDSDGILKESGEAFIADYIGPGPPPGSAPHRYAFLLYQQPEDFDLEQFAPADGKSVGISKRVRYDLASFEKAAKLGPVLASTYFCSN